jgi:hypothetical protein
MVVIARRREAAHPPISSTQRDDDIANVLGAIDQVLRGDWHAGRVELLRIVTQGRAAAPDARALGASGLALIDVLLRSDPRSALATLSAALNEAAADQLAPHAAAYVYAVAACAHALPDATLFDTGRVHAHAARAEELARGDLPDVAFIAWLSTMLVAIMVTDDELLQRAFARLDVAPWTDLPPLLAVHELEARALRAMFAGQRAVAVKLTDDVIVMAAARGYGVVEARSLALSALRKLDELEQPDSVIAVVRRSQHIARATRGSAGVHTLFAARAEAEAHVRAGRTAEALAALDGIDGYAAETGMPPIQALVTLARVHYLTGRYDKMLEIAESLRHCAVPSMRAACRVNASFVEALYLLGTSEDPGETVAAFERAAVDAKGWNFLVRDVLVLGCTAYIIVGTEADARIALRRVQRLLDKFPSPWGSAHLRRVEGTLAAAHGHWAQGRQLIESAIGTFEAAGDISAAALGKHVIAALGVAFEDPNARVALEESNARLDALGLKAPGALRVGVALVVAQRHTGAAKVTQDAVERLIAPLQRLSVRGAEPVHVQRELVAIASELTSRPTRLEEVDSNGESSVVDQTPNAAGASAFEWFEFGDGAGRRLRLGALTPLDDRARAILSIVGTAGALALEIATLRRAGTPRSDATTDDDAEVPGFIAASPSMRALRSEIAHLAASRATVVVQGESGTGKEIVARAIHDLSTRAKMPYVAFNCAAVPRDLFEGQLFGYKRGAFTGAVRDQPGVLQAAEGGTIFLDEIGELPLDVQPKLLRFLENGEIFPLGEERPHVVDVRVIAATHRDLAALVRERRFREDLYYRLQVIALRIAPLRDRREDIAALTRHFLRQLSTAESPPVLSPDALAKLNAYNWPGNVRELRNVIERALAYSPPPRVIRAEHLKIAVA